MDLDLYLVGVLITFLLVCFAIMAYAAFEAGWLIYFIMFFAASYIVALILKHHLEKKCG